MAGPRRARTRRPATTRATSGTRASAQAAARKTAPVVATSGRTTYTTRALVLGIAVIAVLVTLAVPLRAFVAQRGEIASMEHEQTAQRQRLAALEEQRRLLEDPTYIAAQARERLHFTFPGETTYLLTTPPAKPGKAPVRHGQSQVGGSSSPWYTRLWQSAVSAGSEQPAVRAHK